MSLVFVWDQSKAAENLKKHGVSFDEAREAFYDPNQLTMHDEQHSEDEDRFLLLGRTQAESSSWWRLQTEEIQFD